MAKSSHNDEERRQWVNNDEGLYDLWRCSRQAQKQWIRENRTAIDAVIEKVTAGEQPAHYLKYGQIP